MVVCEVHQVIAFVGGSRGDEDEDENLFSYFALFFLSVFF